MLSRVARRWRRNGIRSVVRADNLAEALEDRLVLALNVPPLSSLPGADKTIYLDYDGHTVTGTGWNGYYNQATLNAPAYSIDSDRNNFSSTEISRIIESFHRMAEDFRPFNVNVTTVDPGIEALRRSPSTDTKFGLRVIITNEAAMVTDPDERCRCGGIAYIRSFNSTIDLPVWVYTTGGKSIAEAGSHEVGHALGLSHDGLNGGTTYYRGHGDGDVGWASIMGVGYYENVSQWDDGTYYNSNNGGSGANYGAGPDDLQIITTGVGKLGYRPDDHSNLTNNTATDPNRSGTSVNAFGRIETEDDVDVFRIISGPGTIDLDIDPFTPGPNLDIEAKLVRPDGSVAAMSNPPTKLDANINFNVPAAGIYFLQIDGIGYGTPGNNPPTGYTDYASIGRYDISGTVPDYVPKISINDVEVDEDDASGKATFTVTLDGPAPREVRVNYATHDGTAVAPGDYTTRSSTLVFAAGETSKTVEVDIIDDNNREPRETFTVELTSPVAATLLDDTGEATIVDDDTGSGPTLDLLDGFTYEGGKMFVTARLSEPAVDKITIKFTTTDVTATAPGDYKAFKGQKLVIDAGKTIGKKVIPTYQDAADEGNETFTVTAANPTGTVTLGDTVSTMTIRDDDDPDLPGITISDVTVTEGETALFTVMLSEAADYEVQLRYETSAGTATAGTDYTSRAGSIRLRAGETKKTVRIKTLTDDVSEGDENFSISIVEKLGPALIVDGTAVATIKDADSSNFAVLNLSDARTFEGARAKVLATISKPVTVRSSFRYTTVDVTAEGGEDFDARNGRISFKPGVTQKWVYIPILQDTADEGNETFRVNVTSVAGAIKVGDGVADVTIVDDDNPALPAVTIADATAAEGKKLKFTVSLSAASPDPFYVQFVTANGTATAGEDYKSRRGTLKIPAGVTSKTINITTYADGSEENTETMTVRLSKPVGAARLTDTEATGNIEDDTDSGSAPADIFGFDFDFDISDLQGDEQALRQLEDDFSSHRYQWHEGRLVAAVPLEWFEPGSGHSHDHSHGFDYSMAADQGLELRDDLTDGDNLYVMDANHTHHNHDHDHDGPCGCEGCMAQLSQRLAFAPRATQEQLFVDDAQTPTLAVTAAEPEFELAPVSEVEESDPATTSGDVAHIAPEPVAPGLDAALSNPLPLLEAMV